MASDVGLRFKWERTFLKGPFTKTQRVVGLALATHFNRQGTAWPSVRTLARESGCTDRTVRRALREIEQAGYLHIQRSGLGAGSGRTNRYQAVIPAAEANSDSESHLEASRNGSAETGFHDQGNGSPRPRKWASATSETGPTRPPNIQEQEEHSAAATDREAIAVAVEGIRGNQSWDGWLARGGPFADRSDVDRKAKPIDCPFYLIQTTALDEPRLKKLAE